MVETLMVAAAMNHLATMKAKILGEKAAANEDMHKSVMNINSDNLLPKLKKIEIFMSKMFLAMLPSQNLRI